jgi:hypothetical protein
MQLGRVLKGEIDLEGITPNKNSGNKIIKSMVFDSVGKKYGPMWNASYNYAKFQLSPYMKKYNSYESLAQVVRKSFKDVGISAQNIDEVFPLRTGQTLGEGSNAYSNIVQVIDKEINQGAKVAFDKNATSRYKKIISARADKNWERVNELVEEHKTKIDDFYKENPKARHVKLTELNYNPKTHKFATPTQIYGDAIPSKILKGMEKFHQKTGLSLDVGSTTTLETAAEDLKKVANTPKKQMEILKKMGYRCLKASGAGEDVACYMDDVKKTRADMNSSSVLKRAMAKTKLTNGFKIASKMPQLAKILKTGVQMGTAAVSGALSITGVGQPIAYAIEGLVEGGFYDNARRKGYSHEQAMAETLTPGLIAGRPEDVPWYGGSEKLREKELYEIKGRNEFIDVDNRPPMQDPEFEKVIGKHDKVKHYVDALEEQDRIYSAIGKKEAAKRQNELAKSGLGGGYGGIPLADLAAASADVQDLARSGAYNRVNQTMNPESMASQAYNTAVEKRDALDQRRRTEYLEKYDPQALEHEQKSFDIYARDKEGKILYEKMTSPYKEKYKEMDKMYPVTDFSDELIDKLLKQSNMYVNPKFKSERRTVQNPQGLELLQGYTYDDLRKFYKAEEKKELDQQKQSYYADNFRMEKAEGGIMNLKKW